MKKFVVFLVSIIILATFVSVYLVLRKDREVISINATRYYYNVSTKNVFNDTSGEFEDQIAFSDNVRQFFNYSTKNISNANKKKIRIRIEQDEQNPVLFRDGTDINTPILAVGPGEAKVIVELPRASDNVRDVLFVTVGNGTSEHPWFIRNETDLIALSGGLREPEDQHFLHDQKVFERRLDSHYLQVNDITLSPAVANTIRIAGEFNGTYRGMQFDADRFVAIKNYSKVSREIDSANGLDTLPDTSAMFTTIGVTGKIGYLNFENVAIGGDFVVASVVAAENNGEIDYVNITSGEIGNMGGNSTASIVGTNNSGARITRCENKALLISRGIRIGGIATENKGQIDFCINAGNILFAQRANETAILGGGIVALNTMDASSRSSITNAKTAYDVLNPGERTPEGKTLDAALTKRPMVANNIFVGDMGIYNDTLQAVEVGAGTSARLGGIIGQEYHYNRGSGATIENAKNDLAFDNLTFGNYFLRQTSIKRCLWRGIGNMGYSAETAAKNIDGRLEFAIENTNFAALSIEAPDFKQGQIFVKVGTDESARRDLVSFIQGRREIGPDTSTVSVNITQNVNVIFISTATGRPTIILPPSNNFNFASPLRPWFYFGNETKPGGGGPDGENTMTWEEYFLSIDFKANTGASPNPILIPRDLSFESWDALVVSSASNRGIAANRAKNFVIMPDPNTEYEASPINPAGPGQKPFDVAGYVVFRNLTISNGVAGLFNFVENARLSNIIFRNLTINTNEANVGIIGDAINLTLENIIVEGLTIVVGGAAKEVGGIVGNSAGSFNATNIRLNGLNISGTTRTDAFVGGMAGSLQGATTVSDVRIAADLVINTPSARAGGFAGRILGGSASSVTRLAVGTRADAATITASHAAGLASTLGASATQIFTNTTLTASNQTSVNVDMADRAGSGNGSVSSSAGGVATIIQANGRIADSEIKTTFTQHVGTTQRAGIAIDILAGSNAQAAPEAAHKNAERVLFENNFLGGNNTHNYSISRALVMNTNTDAQPGGSLPVGSFNYESTAGRVNNVFFVNKYDNVQSTNEGLTTFYQNRCNGSAPNGWNKFASVNGSNYRISRGLGSWFYVFSVTAGAGQVDQTTGRPLFANGLAFSYDGTTGGGAGFSSSNWSNLSGRPRLSFI